MSGGYTVGVLARSFGLARSSLLYYDRIGLLRPSQRSTSRYRLYGEDARERLEAICTYRRVGLGLAEIRTLLDARGGRTLDILTIGWTALLLWAARRPLERRSETNPEEHYVRRASASWTMVWTGIVPRSSVR